MLHTKTKGQFDLLVPFAAYMYEPGGHFGRVTLTLSYIKIVSSD